MTSIIPRKSAGARWISSVMLVGASVAIAACSDNSTEFVGSAAILTVTGGSQINGQVGDSLGPFVVKVTDTAGTGVAGVAVNFTITGPATLVNSTATTDKDGGAFTSIAFTHVAGTVTITATVSGIATPAVFNTYSYAGPATKFVLVGGNSQSGGRGTMLGDNLSVRVTDQYDNGISNVQVTWQSAAGTFGTPSGHTGVDGTAFTSYTLPAVAGVQAITATAQLGATPSTLNFSATAN